MKNYNKILIIILSILIIMALTSCSQEKRSNNQLNIDKKALLTQLNLGEQTEIIESKAVDVTGDGNKDNVILLGAKSDDSKSSFRDNLLIIVQESKSKKYLKATYNNFSGYEPKLTIKELTGDKVADVMVSANSGGSIGIYHHLIASFKAGKAKVIFDANNNQGVKVSGQFIPNFKAKLNFIDLQKESLLDISINKENYIKQKIYDKKGNLIKRILIRPYANPFSKLETVDYDHDGQYELKGIQQIVGSSNSDEISKIESIWSYHNNKWILKEVSYDTFLLKYSIKQKSNPIATGYIKKIGEHNENNYILLVNKLDNTKNFEGIKLFINKDTKLLDEKTNTKIKFKDLKVGMKIKAHHSKIMTMSLPPQTKAIKIIVTNK
ncbi:hypothetical protein [Orenia marismortui]|uniref:Uncharacterized protein n=1 Tax=Orenia marismortui TaxID=46469 RepID=A0A4V3GX65_9FIRM|nr:hypothetical protein [Orenia marismortui]TDX46769.1 hypothetical protein C7959_1361 [Orenia marismortui]